MLVKNIFFAWYQHQIQVYVNQMIQFSNKVKKAIKHYA